MQSFGELHAEQQLKIRTINQQSHPGHLKSHSPYAQIVFVVGKDVCNGPNQAYTTPPSMFFYALYSFLNLFYTFLEISEVDNLR